MRTFLKISALCVLLSVFGSCKTAKTNASEKEVTVDNYKDSFVVRYHFDDSTVYHYKDSTVTREGINTGVVIKVAEKINPFNYHLKRGNILFAIIGDSTGNISINIDMAAEIAYREKWQQEYQQHTKDSIAATQKSFTKTYTKTIYRTTVRTVWPWWLYLLIAVTLISLFLKFQYPIKNLITHWRTKYDTK